MATIDTCNLNSVLSTLLPEEIKKLPLISLPAELEDLPPLPVEEEEKMRILARHAIEVLLERLGGNILQKSHKEITLERNNG